MQSKRHNPFWSIGLAWGPACAWAAAIFWMSSRLETPTPTFWLPPHADKIIHAVLYAILAGLIHVALRMRGFPPPRAAWWALGLASLYGITDEWHQSMVANRHADVMDWIADTVGAAWVVFAARHETRWFPGFLHRKFSP